VARRPFGLDFPYPASSLLGDGPTNNVSPGVSAEQDVLPKIFSPFFRVEESRDASSGGIGLGLAVAQRAVAIATHDAPAMIADRIGKL
jgi:K+-sensing histidine kinase KdpD